MWRRVLCGFTLWSGVFSLWVGTTVTVGQTVQAPLKVGVWSYEPILETDVYKAGNPTQVVNEDVEARVPVRWVYPEPYLWFEHSSVQDDELLAVSMDQYHDVTDELYLFSPHQPRLRTFELWSQDGVVIEQGNETSLIELPALRSVDHTSWVVSMDDFVQTWPDLLQGGGDTEIWLNTDPNTTTQEILQILEKIRLSAVRSVWIETSLYQTLLEKEPFLKLILEDWSMGRRTPIPFEKPGNPPTQKQQPTLIWAALFVIFALFIQRQMYYSQRLYRTFINGRAGITLRSSRNIQEGRWSVLWMIAAVLFFASIIPIWIRDGFSAQIVHGLTYAEVLPYAITNTWTGIAFWFPIMFCWIGFQWVMIYFSSHQPSLSESSSILGWMEHLHVIWIVGWILLFGFGVLDQGINWVFAGAWVFQVLFGVVAIWNMTRPGHSVVVFRSILWSFLSVGIPTFLLLLLLQTTAGQIAIRMVEILS